MIGKTILQYRILEKLGEGGMGVVYKAEDTELDRDVAIKFLPRQIASSAEERERFKVEARAAAALNHPNIATIYTIEKTDEETFIVMEYIKGQELKDKIDAGPLPIDDALNIAIQIAQGLQIAHEAGVVHRDIKSSNIMLTDRGDAKIMDFGLAKVRGGPKLTKDQSTLGTAPYMSPEQTRGEEVDRRTDVFSLGVLIYEMLTGQMPFKGDYEQAVSYSILNEDPQPVTALRTGIPMELERIITKCLQKDPSSRYQHADELLVDLKAQSELHKSGVSQAQSMPVASSDAQSRKRGLLFGGIATLVLLAAVTWVLIRSFSPDETTVDSSDTPSIAIMYFENRSSEEDLDKILVDMLTTNLARQEGLDVVSSQRLYDILKNMGKLNMGTIDRTVATDVALQANVRTMLMGSIIQIGNRLRITSQLSDVKTGDIIASEQVEGEKIEDVFAMVDELTEKIKNELVAPLGQAELPKIADVTTTNYRAYQLYQRGQEHYWRFDFANAAKNFERSLDMDSTFAMAHLWLAVSRYIFRPWNHLADMAPVQERMALAKNYSKGISHKDSLFIATFAALFDRKAEESIPLFSRFVSQYPNEKDGWLHLSILHYMHGDLKRSIEQIRKVLTLDPTYANGQNLLGYYLIQDNQREEAFAATKKYIDLQPDVSNTYDTAFEVFMMAGELDRALASCDEALKINPEWRRFNLRKGYINLFLGNGEAARVLLHQSTTSNPDQNPGIMRNEASFDLYEGRHRDALKTLHEAKRVATTRQNSSQARSVMLDTGKFLTAIRRFDEALAAFEEVQRFSKRLYQTEVTPVDVIAAYWIGVIYLKKGEQQRSRQQIDVIEKLAGDENLGPLFLDYAYLLRAEIALANNNPEPALQAMERMSGYSKNSPRRALMKVMALTQAKDLDTADAELRRIRDNILGRSSGQGGGDLFEYFYLRSQANYLLGRIHEVDGDEPRAIQYFTQAIEQWRNADADHEQLINAKARLAKLKGSSSP